MAFVVFVLPDSLLDDIMTSLNSLRVAFNSHRAWSFEPINILIAAIQRLPHFCFRISINFVANSVFCSYAASPDQTESALTSSG